MVQLQRETALYIVFRFVFQDSQVFQQQRSQFIACGFGADLRYALQPFSPLAIAAKMGNDAFAQVDGFADVYRAPFGIEEIVDSRMLLKFVGLYPGLKQYGTPFYHRFKEGGAF